MRRQPWYKKPASRRSAAGKRSKNSLKLESLESRQMLAADVVSLSPTDGATNVSEDSNLVLTFASDVKVGPGAGRILIMNAADDSLVEAVNVDDAARVTFSGATVTVDPVKALPSDAKFYVKIDAGAIRDTASTKADGVLYRENFETLHLLDSDKQTDGVFNPESDFNQYGVFMTGTLVVTEENAGDYTFGSNSDDGGYLLIDLNGDGVLDAFDDSEDDVLWDDTTHGNQDLLSTVVNLKAGEYKFEYVYFDGDGGSSGEAFYGKGELTAFDAAKFALIGDGAQGISVTEEGIKATTYRKPPDEAIVNIQGLLDMRNGDATVAENYPQSAIIKTANIFNTGGHGNFAEDEAPVPGAPPIDLGEGTDYNITGPTGYVLERNQDSEAVEYSGWTFLDKNFWINEQGNQERNTFTKGQNVVAVMDPDAFDDYGGVDFPLEAYMTLPGIDLTDVTANTVKLKFDSSFRPEGSPGQTAIVDVSFDGGANWENVLYYDTDTTGGVANTLDYADEAISLDITNPAGGSMLVRFGMVNASNNWWWAVDNIEVTGNAVGDLYDGIADRTTWDFDTIESAPTLQGDFNADGKVDLTDFGILKSNFGTGTTAAQGDANGDAKVDLTDFGILKTNFGKTAAAAAVVPAPAAVAQATDYAFALGLAQAAKSATDGNADPFADDSL